MSKHAKQPGSVSVALTGAGGAGVVTAGSMLIKAAARAGWYGLLTRSVGPQIRGGEAASLVRLARRPVDASPERYDMLLAIDWLNIERFADEIPLDAASLVVVDPEAGAVPGFITDSGARICELPMQEMVGEIKGGRVNMLALGIIGGLIGLPETVLAAVIETMIAGKGAGAVAASLAAARAGLAAAVQIGDRGTPAPAGDGSGRWIINGNQAVGLGAVRAGVRFVAAYPITPATEVLEWMAPALAKVGGTLVQAEDELASINMAIGASFGGTPSLTATSGPGLALMTESIGLASAAEVPVVVVDVMRVGPSTGIATKSEQSDLNIAVYGQHGDAAHVVVAPNSVGDCLFTAQWAAHLAEALQLPALVLSDQYLGQTQTVIDRPAEVAFIAQRARADTSADNGYKRYAVTDSGVSPMSIPGMAGGQYTADGLEHNERGTPSSGARDHNAQMDKRQAKLENFDFGDHWAEIEGSGDLAVITWGSCTGPAREALERCRDAGIEARLISLRLLLPTQPERLAAALEGARRLLVIDQTHGGQLHRYLRAHYDLPAAVRSYHRPGPLPILPSEIEQQIQQWGSS
jgi:2-oxoglutarate/2-oxoacid ferredoxin oxidoreductase subunit alpha